MATRAVNVSFKFLDEAPTSSRARRYYQHDKITLYFHDANDTTSFTVHEDEIKKKIIEHYKTKYNCVIYNVLIKDVRFLT